MFVIYIIISILVAVFLFFTLKNDDKVTIISRVSESLLLGVMWPVYVPIKFYQRVEDIFFEDRQLKRLIEKSILLSYENNGATMYVKDVLIKGKEFKSYIVTQNLLWCDNKCRVYCILKMIDGIDVKVTLSDPFEKNILSIDTETKEQSIEAEKKMNEHEERLKLKK